MIDLTPFNYLANPSEVSVEASRHRQQALSNTGAEIRQCPRENNVRLCSVQQAMIYAGDQQNIS
jgi:hypothetical protein